MLKSELKILLVDDQIEVLNAFKDFFELEDLISDVAHSGNEAIKKINENDYHIVISDIRMPDGDGFDLLKHVQSLEKEKPRIFIISGQIDKEGLFTEESILEMGAERFIPKPFEIDDIYNDLVKIFDLED